MKLLSVESFDKDSNLVTWRIIYEDAPNTRLWLRNMDFWAKANDYELVIEPYHGKEEISPRNMLASEKR